jgi:tRNA(Ile)-lysidine synthase
LLAVAVLPRQFMVATVDHGLRRESADEAAAVAALCAVRGLAHTVIVLDLEAGPAVQARARAARYAALGGWARARGLAALVTAHHADDQAETLLMRLNRGAGVRGLAAMRAVSVVPGWPECPLLRPLLGWRRSELVSVVAAAGISPADDPTNRDLCFERARLRAGLATAPWLDGAALAASAGHLAEADAVLEWAADRAYAAATREGTMLLWTPDETPRAVAMRVLERIVACLGHGVPRGSALARWYDQLAAGRIATLAGVRGDGRGVVWRFAAAAPPRSLLRK